MLGWMIFKHSMGMVTRNLTNAIKIALVPALIGVVVLVAIYQTTGLSALMLADEAAVEQMILDQGLAAFGLPFLLSFLCLMVIELWVFVSWHRFILLEEYPTGWIPTLRTDRILAYFGKIIMLGLIAIGAGIALTLVVTIIAAIGGNAGGIIAVPLMTVFWIAMIVVLYRLTPILPAAAIGKPLKISEAWDATRGSGWAIVLVLVLIFIVQFLVQIVAGLSMMVFAPLGFVFLLLMMLVMTLLNVSVLTTLYGHYVEGRPLV